jgi:Fe-S-cluster containining protein
VIHHAVALRATALALSLLPFRLPRTISLGVLAKFSLNLSRYNLRNMTELCQLHEDIDARVQAIRGSRPDWLCGKGCDSCCRRLADVPQLSEVEWIFLREGLATLPQERLRKVSRDISDLASQQSRPVVCPLLDQSTGACMVYAQRPVACRTYGYYVQRELGLYCRDIESRVAAGTLVDVVWGNHDAIDRRLGGLGETLALTEWFERWKYEKYVAGNRGI